MQLIITWILSACALILTSKVLNGIKLNGFGAALLSTFVLGALNATIFRVLWFLTLPFTILTLGLFLLVLNGAMLKLTAKLVNGFKIDGWLSAIVGSIVLSITQSILYFFYRRLFE
ncbi:MAG: phage holin family protein [Chitinophagaceae bacterium]|nr:phage holin family protein [Oligoflexus sp.]